jgi:type II secretory pathway pseudopilin PulG
MAALLVSLAVMSVLMAAVLPAWRFQARREKEAELVFRGEQYARAVGLFARKNGGAFPPSLDVLVQGRYLRKKYNDPMVEDGEFQPLFAGMNMPGQPQPGGAGRGGAGRGGGVGGAGAGTGARGSGGRVGSPPVMSGGSTPTSGTPFQSAPGQTGVGGLIGVVSKSKETSIMIYRGATRYNEWVFRYAGLQNQPGAVPGQGTPGFPTAPGMGGPRGGRGGPRGGPQTPRGGFPPMGRGRGGRGMRPPG